MGNDTSTTTSGWRVLATDVRGPCNESNIIPFFEYIIGVKGKRLDGVAVNLKEELSTNCNKPIDLTILNYKTLKTRKITVCPSDDWGGVGLLGLIITYDNFKTADERVVRVLSVHPGSPAECAGLHPFVDYILGTESYIFHGIGSFEDYISSNIEVELTLRVYNSKLCQVREVRITPRYWGNSDSKGVLGCEVSSGLLHKVPDLPDGACLTIRETQRHNTPLEADKAIPTTILNANTGKALEMASPTPDKVACEISNVISKTQLEREENGEAKDVPFGETTPSTGEKHHDTTSNIPEGIPPTVECAKPASQYIVEANE